MRKRLCLLLMAAVLLIAACEAPPTPLPVVIEPTTAATPTPPNQTIRYALAPNAVNSLIDRASIEPYAQLIALDAPPTADGLGAQYDLAVALGRYDGAQQSTVPYVASLVIRTDVPPLDNAEVQAIIRRAAVPAELIAGLDIPGVELLKDESLGSLRADLASAGYPDGFDLTISSAFVPGIEAFAARLREAGITVEVVPMESTEAAVQLVAGSSAEGRIDLFRAPISYWIAPGVPLQLSANGFPLPPRAMP